MKVLGGERVQGGGVSNLSEDVGDVGQVDRRRGAGGKAGGRGGDRGGWRGQTDLLSGETLLHSGDTALAGGREARAGPLRPGAGTPGWTTSSLTAGL